MRASLLAASGGLLLLAACGGGGEPTSPPPPPSPPPAAVATVTLSITEATLVPQQQVTIGVTLRDGAGNVLTGRPVTWSTTAASVASVSNEGVVAGVSAGSATIAASSEGKSASAAITVVDGAVVPTSGGSVSAGGGAVTVSIPTGALAAVTTITVRPVTTAPSDPAVVAGTWYDFGPSGAQFSQPVTIRIRYTAAQVSVGADETLFRLFALSNGAWTPVPGSTVEPATRTVSGTTSHFSGYAIGRIPPPPAEVTFATITMGLGGATVCGLTPQGEAWCWGRNLHVAVGDGTKEQRNSPVRVTGNRAYAKVSAGGLHTCALTPAGEAWCWGTGPGAGAEVGLERLVPTQIPGPALVDISAGALHTCGRTAQGRVWCWGRNSYGELGNGGTETSTVPVQVTADPTFSQVSAGYYRTCGVAQSGLGYCWGDNGAADIAMPTQLGVLGVGSLAGSVTAPLPVVNVPQFAEVRAGLGHGCGRNPAGVLLCWGVNLYGQAGDGTMTIRTSPVLVSTGMSFSAHAVGAFHACALSMAGEAWCWGRNAFGQLGTGTTESSLVPVKVIGGLRFTQLVLGSSTTCGVATEGDTWCWGFGQAGTIGDGAGLDRLEPVRVTP